MFPQIASFSVTPNYEIAFFSSEVFEVVKILDFLNEGGKPKNMIEELRKFKVDGKTNI